MSSSSRRNYAVGQRSFINFVRLHGLYNSDGSFLPASQDAILQWLTSLAGHIQPKTIKSYLTHVRALHIDADLPFHHAVSPIVQRLIRGIKRYHGEPGRKPKLPITLPILLAILSHLQPNIYPLHRTIHAACCLAYSGLLRCGEFTTPTHIFNPAIHLTTAAVKFQPSFTNPEYIELTLPASKTDPFRTGVTLVIAAAPGQASCPVSSLLHLLSSQPRPPTAPLFSDTAGNPLTRKLFIDSIRAALTSAHFDASAYSGHSFRRGGATAAAAAGFSEQDIQLIGRWRSDAFKLYIDVGPQRLLHLSKFLHWAQPQALSPAPPAL